ncbi:HECT E3 ubiquitin ligase [Achlya hypogyna]|uniref:HECT-type E3 ubiquitin transferase n=1 Tax=Achlya hypogyna TaxID=1202772 RepID=A0A1V9YI20_ACHHY|nr:HECT E3 ubiquitin ligase [Achlya hypogyna]
MAILFGMELSSTMAGLVYALLGIALVLLIGAIIYYWNYAKRIERFLQNDNRNNNMLRQDLIDTFVARGEEEWPCSICFHDNHPSKKECVMCGTPQVVIAPNLPRPSGLRKSDFVRPELNRSKSTVLDQQSRIRSFHVRRLKQMNLTARQKAAMRRHLWRRKKGPDGTMHWVRIDADENDPTRESTVDMELMDPNHHEIDIMSPISNTGSSIEEHDPYEAHVALAMRDLGYDDDTGATPFRPLRATALKQLEEAEERTSMFHSGVMPDYLGGFGYGKGQLQLPAVTEEDRRNNFTTLSTGYVRHENADGGMEFAPATAVAMAESRQMDCDDDLEEIAALTFQEKNRWFLEQVQKRWRSYDQGHIQFVVRRDHLIEDSMEQMLKCPASRFWERLRIFFENEPGLDAGGLIREWYELLSDKLFSEEMGLFTATKGSNLAYWINPASKSIRGENHLLYYEFVGRLIGKALIEGFNVKMSLALPLIKHMLGVPISFSDLEFLDEELYRNCRWLKKNDQAELLSLDFTVQVVTPDGSYATIDLKPNGANIEVTDANKAEYLDLLFKHYMFESMSTQLAAFLKGFYEIVPLFLISVFDYQEFDLLLSGIPDIDCGDWRAYSEVRWIKLEQPSTTESAVVGWFWNVVQGFSGEERARLLQFATGTSRVPVQGFKGLTSSDGRVRRFTIQMVNRGPPPTGLMPKGHTCFNRIDLPLYSSQEELAKYLTLVINMEITGFWLE